MASRHPQRRTAIVFASAPIEPTPRVRQRLAGIERPFVVAADGGAAAALLFGYQPDVVVGDLDSIQRSTLVELRARGVPIETYPRDKDATDGQLAIQRAVLIEPGWVLLLGFLGGPRLDQALANVLLLTSIAVPAVLLDERNECRLVRPGVEHTWPTEPGEVVSLIPIGASAEGVRTRGLRWPLAGESLAIGQTRGISNEPAAGLAVASVSVRAGSLLVTRHFPDERRA